MSSQYGDLFDGEKVSQLTSSTFGQDSESESEKEHKREPARRSRDRDQYASHGSQSRVTIS